ncbi:MAG TPA: GGDEF domain-containing protein [Longimicrobium sp.]|nr:GGDEF domain-containing protein [Longimicrobium sp.]
MRIRRREDRRLRLVTATPTGWISGAELTQRRQARRREPWREAIQARDGDSCACGDDVVLLLDGAEGQGVLVAGAVTATLPTGADHEDLLARAATGAAVALQERLRAEKRQRLPDQLIDYFEALNAAEGQEGVFHALAEHALRIVGGHTALPLVRDGRRGMLRAPGGGEGHRAALLWDERLARPGLLLCEDARAGGPAAFAAPLFGDPATALVAHVPVGDEAVLVLTERRDERIFEPEDWDVLRALALQAEMALRRVRLIESVRSLSLTDPLTGLGNRRHMEVVLQHAWAAARRGDPLAVMVMDLDRFKCVNDCEGHHAGDRLLCEVADALRAEARGADLVVRYGGDEFLVILPRGEAAGARALEERVRQRLAGRVEFSAGIAVHRAEHESPEHLIREADRRLYEAKEARGRAR